MKPQDPEKLSTKEFLTRFRDKIDSLNLSENTLAMTNDFLNGMSMEEIQKKYNQKKQTVYFVIKSCAEKLYRAIPEGYLWDPAKGNQVNQDID